MKKLILSLLTPICLFFCPGRAQQAAPFPYVTPPAILGGEVAEAEWVALNFWSAYDFAAAESRYAAEANRRGFVDFISTLYATNPKLSAEAIERMMSLASASEDGYWYFLELAEKFLYDPNSPLRNDLLWESFLHHAISPQSPLDDDSKVRYRMLLAIVSRNQQGSVATDFEYTCANGSRGRLHQIDSPLLLIYFYNPGCSECGRVKAQLDASGLLDALHARGVLQVLAVHPDEELTEWRKHLADNPSWWISAYDKGGRIRRDDLYDLKAIPTFYLLDVQKRVMMKDPTVEDLIGVLSNL